MTRWPGSSSFATLSFHVARKRPLRKESIGDIAYGAVVSSLPHKHRVHLGGGRDAGLKPDPVADKALEHELKLLYVGLTRAQSSVWIFEGPLRGAHWTPDACAAPFYYLQAKSLAKAVQAGTVVEPLF